MNPVLRWLSTQGKDAIAKKTTAEASDRSVPEGLVLLADLAYESADGTPLAADVYRPVEATADPLPVAVFVHGGGLFVGSRKTNRVYAELSAKCGYVVFVPEYRYIDEADGPHIISDVCVGLAYLKDHAAEFGGDMARLLIAGESAGAFLALYATALTGSLLLRQAFGIEVLELSVRGLACFGGMFYTAGNDPIGLLYRRDLYGKRLRDAMFRELVNPEDPRIDASLPSVFMVTSGTDFIKSHTLRYSRSLAMTGHAHRLIYYQKGKKVTHAFASLKPELPQSHEVLHELDAWFRELC